MTGGSPVKTVVFCHLNTANLPRTAYCGLPGCCGQPDHTHTGTHHSTHRALDKDHDSLTTDTHTGTHHSTHRALDEDHDSLTTDTHTGTHHSTHRALDKDHVVCK